VRRGSSGAGNSGGGGGRRLTAVAHVTLKGLPQQPRDCKFRAGWEQGRQPRKQRPHVFIGVYVVTSDIRGFGTTTTGYGRVHLCCKGRIGFG
jgi:hypothetical protein